MEVSILGPLEVMQAGSLLPLGGAKQRAVLAMLALNVNRVVPMSFLIDGLWDHPPPGGGTSAVQVYVSRLRRVLPGEGSGQDAGGVIRSRQPGYVLEIDRERVDLQRFRRLAREGADALPGVPLAAAGLLREALDLWRGPPLADFAGMPFARAEVPWLEEQRFNAIIAKIDADLALGGHMQLIGELEVLLAEHPLHERLHEQLILALYRSGRQAEALQAYRRVHRGLTDELGLDPGRALRELVSCAGVTFPMW